MQKWEAEGVVARWGDGRLGEISSTVGKDGLTRIDWGSFTPNDASKARA